MAQGQCSAESICSFPALLVENGKFLLCANRTARTTCTEYVIPMDADNISRSSSTYIGKLRSNFLGTKFIIYDTQPPYNIAQLSPSGRSFRFYSNKVSPKVPTGSYNIAQVITYDSNSLLLMTCFLLHPSRITIKLLHKFLHMCRLLTMFLWFMGFCCYLCSSFTILSNFVNLKT